MTEHRDTTVADALRRLDVPDHAPGFWDELEVWLADTEARSVADRPEAADAGSAEVIDLGDAQSKRRPIDPRRRPLLALVAATAAVVVLVVGATVLRPGGDSESQVDSADEVAPPDTDRADDGTAPDTGDEDVAVSPLAAEELAAEWLTLLRAGEVEVAHARLDGPSKGALSLEQFREVATALAEGAGAFAGDGVTSTTATIARPGGPPATVVVFSGNVQREGMVETAAYPVVVTGDDRDSHGIAFVLDGPTVEFEQLSSPTETRTSPVLVRTGGESWFLVDGSEPQRLGESPASIDVEAVAGAGTHVVTVVATEGGVYTARAVTVVVP